MAKPLEEQIAKMEGLVAQREKKIKRIAQTKKIIQWITAIIVFLVGFAGGILSLAGGQWIPAVGYLILGGVFAFLFYVASGFVLGFLMLKEDARARSEKALLEGQIKEMRKRK